MARSKDECLLVELGPDSSLDVIRLEDMTVMFVIAERGSVQRRTVAMVNGDDAVRIAKFLVGIRGADDE